ncbi:MAG: GTPase HflX [Defluviitaleaceae bacterium]|nr:GTPase HflX [Defluviitaleaceae bacterium]
MFNTNETEELAILVALEDDKSSLDELAELVRTAGGREVGRLTQNREAAHRGHYLGKGKLEELADLVSLTGATAIVCDDELTSSQQRGLAEAVDAKILDRTMIILDIFAAHASTAEGKLQVELAQLGYSISHLSGLGTQLSRLGGGIGTRGPGEKKLETDRRHIRARMEQLKREIDDALKHRQVARKARQRASVPSVAIVGYTNAGKSTLMNAISDAGVAAQDKLFMTLDTTTRSVKLSTGQQILLSDTVGFIRKLPHKLVDAFRATLEELTYADILLHVIDAADPDCERHIAVVKKTLAELGLSEKPTIAVFNKIDALQERPMPIDKSAVRTVYTSALNGIGLDTLVSAIEDVVNSSHTRMQVCIPYTDGSLISQVYKDGLIQQVEERADGTFFEVLAGGKLKSQLEKYKCSE